MNGPTPSTTLSHGLGSQPGGARATRAIRWAGMALPLGACLAIWILGPDGALDVAWLRTLHQVIGLAVLMWTALRLARQPRSLKPRMIVTTTKEWLLTMRLSLAMLYALLVLQPLLALSARMLAGERIAVWGMAVPSVLPVNVPLARDVAYAHGWNAVLLLALIAAHVVAELYRAALHRPQMARVGLGEASSRRPQSFKCSATEGR